MPMAAAARAGPSREIRVAQVPANRVGASWLLHLPAPAGRPEGVAKALLPSARQLDKVARRFLPPRRPCR